MMRPPTSRVELPQDVGQGFCSTQGPHVHAYAPFDSNLFRQQNGAFYFVGDPFDFGYSQSLFWYRGNHPVPMAATCAKSSTNTARIGRQR